MCEITFPSQARTLTLEVFFDFQDFCWRVQSYAELDNGSPLEVVSCQQDLWLGAAPFRAFVLRSREALAILLVVTGDHLGVKAGRETLGNEDAERPGSLDLEEQRSRPARGRREPGE